MNALDRVPGLAGFLQQRQMAQQKQAADLQSAGTVLGLQGALEKQRRMGKLQEVLAASNGDPEKAIPALIASGDVETAAQLSAIAETRRRASLPQPLQSLGAGGGYDPATKTTIPPAARPGPPQTRRVRIGDQEVTQEYQTDGSWKEIGRGPAFAAQVAPSREPPAPTVTEIVDPKNPKRMLRINARTFDQGKYMAGDNTGVLGVSGKEPAAQKADDLKEGGRKQITTLVDNLAADYGVLQKRGDLVDPKRSAMGNLYERAAASGVGQAVAGAVGTEAQQIRDRINNSKPLLMAAIKQSSGMSSQQMNSNAELQFYLQAATDVTKGYETNIAALHLLDSAYGLGTGVQASPEAVAALQRLAEQRFGKSGRINSPAPAQGGWSIRQLD